MKLEELSKEALIILVNTKCIVTEKDIQIAYWKNEARFAQSRIENHALQEARGYKVSIRLKQDAIADKQEAQEKLTELNREVFVIKEEVGNV